MDSPRVARDIGRSGSIKAYVEPGSPTGPSKYVTGGFFEPYHFDDGRIRSQSLYENLRPSPDKSHLYEGPFHRDRPKSRFNQDIELERITRPQPKYSEDSKYGQNVVPEIEDIPPKYNGNYDDSVTTSEETTMEDTALKTSQSRNGNIIAKFQDSTSSVCNKYSSFIGRFFLFAILIGYTVYFGFAINYSVKYNANTSTALIVLTSVSAFLVLYVYVRDHFGDTIYVKILQPLGDFLSRHSRIIKWLLTPAIFIGLVLYLSLSVIHEIKQLQSLSGFIVFVLLTYVFSKHPDRVNWRPVIGGFGLQFMMAIIVLRWKFGYESVKWLSEQITTFINYSMDGAASVFGDPFFLFHPFVFVAMPMLIYIGAVMSILYYLGLTQMVAAKVGWFVQVTMHTTAIESLGVASNIFLNGMDVMLMLRYYLDKLTTSEFHCFLVGNHSTVAGFAFAIFVMFGAPPQHLLSAAVMSAPAAIAISKLSWPEIEESITKTQEDVQLDKGEESNVIEAGANGAAVAGKTVTAVVVNFIGFLALLAFVNASLSWLGGRVGYSELSFEIICSYLFMPLALIMGVDWNQCREVAKLIGIKVFTSEVLAYQELGSSIAAGALDDRSTSIATYAMCGFSGLSTLAIAVGVWNSLCPSKVKDMTGMMLRVIVNANLSCFMTACIAGLMYDQEIDGSDPVTGTPGPLAGLIGGILGLIPSYKQLLNLLG